MRNEGNQQQPNRERAGRVISSWTLARASWLAPKARLAFVLLRAILPPGRRLAAYLVVLAGLGCQLVLLWLAGEVIDLYVSAVELWAELARKHLELQLS